MLSIQNVEFEERKARKFPPTNLIDGGTECRKFDPRLSGERRGQLAIWRSSWRGVIRTGRIASFSFAPPQVHRGKDRGVIWIQGNCVLRKAEEPSHFKPDSKHGLFPVPWDKVAGSGESVYCSSSWQDRKRERRFSLEWEKKGVGESISTIFALPRLSAISILRLTISGIRIAATESILPNFAPTCIQAFVIVNRSLKTC